LAVASSGISLAVAVLESALTSPGWPGSPGGGGLRTWLGAVAAEWAAFAEPVDGPTPGVRSRRRRRRPGIRGAGQGLCYRPPTCSPPRPRGSPIRDGRSVAAGQAAGAEADWANVGLYRNLENGERTRSSDQAAKARLCNNLACQPACCFDLTRVPNARPRC